VGGQQDQSGETDRPPEGGVEGGAAGSGGQGMMAEELAGQDYGQDRSSE
jgi:hypothetical protein